MNYVVIFSKSAQKDLQKIPRYILVLFDLWIEVIETEGYFYMQTIRGYRDHALKGNRQNQRSSSLNKSWRVIYKLNGQLNTLTIEVIEVNHHDY